MSKMADGDLRTFEDIAVRWMATDFDKINRMRPRGANCRLKESFRWTTLVDGVQVFRNTLAVGTFPDLSTQDRWCEVRPTRSATTVDECVPHLVAWIQQDREERPLPTTKELAISVRSI